MQFRKRHVHAWPLAALRSLWPKAVSSPSMKPPRTPLGEMTWDDLRDEVAARLETG